MSKDSKGHGSNSKGSTRTSVWDRMSPAKQAAARMADAASPQKGTYKVAQDRAKAAGSPTLKQTRTAIDAARAKSMGLAAAKQGTPLSHVVTQLKNRGTHPDTIKAASAAYKGSRAAKNAKGK